MVKIQENAQTIIAAYADDIMISVEDIGLTINRIKVYDIIA